MIALRPFSVALTLLCLGCWCIDEARADLKPGAAKKLILRAGGMRLPSNTVRVREVNALDATTATAKVEIETALRLEKDASGFWQVMEVRTAPDVWESVPLLARTMNLEVPSESCHEIEMLRVRGDVADPTVKSARCLIARLIGVTLPSDSVRIKSVSSMAIPLASNPSSLVVAVVTLQARFSQSGKEGWRLTGFRGGGEEWIDPQHLREMLNERKRIAARKDLETLAAALEKFRSERGYYVVSEKEAVLVDYLNPRYLDRVVRVDPWNRPYRYNGDRDRYTLSSTGADGLPNTSDDVVLVKP